MEISSSAARPAASPTPTAATATATPPPNATRAPAAPLGMTAAERAQFLREGCLRLEQIATADDFAVLSGIYDECFGPAAQARAGVRHKALGGTDGAGRQTLPQVLGPSRQYPELQTLPLFHRCRAIAEFVFGQPVELRSEHMILKPARYGVTTPWHQDQAYHDPALDYRQMNFWIPLEDATRENGCLHFVPGSHLGPVLPHEYLVRGNDDTALVAQDQAYWTANSIALPVARGGVTLHHSYMLHFAGPNQTAHDRRAYILVFGCQPTPRARPWQFPWRTDARHQVDKR